MSKQILIQKLEKKITGKITYWNALSRLPDAFQEVEWIQGLSANQGQNWIKTSIVPTSNMVTTFVFSWEQYVQYERLMQYGGYFHAETINTNNGVIEFKGGSQSATKIADSANVPLSTKTTVQISSNGCYVAGAKVCDLPATNESSTATITLLHNDFGQYQDHDAVAKIYEFYIEVNGEKIMDLIPCYRKSDNVIGLYDLCENLSPNTNTPFFTNQGTGSFAKGPDVNN